MSDPRSGPDAKSSVRAVLHRRRRERETHARAAAGAGILEHLLTGLNDRGAELVAAHVPIDTEPGTPALPAALHDAGLRVLLPVVLPDRDLDWAAYDGPHSLLCGALGVPEPASPRWGVAAVSRADAVVVPALAVDVCGVRLGRGGGCYDRALSRVSPWVPVVALLYDDELLDRLPAEPHDRPVTAVVTPTGGWRDL